jgi:hypothetical protein
VLVLGDVYDYTGMPEEFRISIKGNGLERPITWSFIGSTSSFWSPPAVDDAGFKIATEYL